MFAFYLTLLRSHGHNVDSISFSFISESFCDPMGDYNVFGFLRLLNNSEPLDNHSVIIAAAKVSFSSDVTDIVNSNFS